MSRTITGAVDTALLADHVEACHLVQIYLQSGTVYLTDSAHDLVWQSNTYIGVGAMGRIEHAAETDQIEATPLRFTLAGPIGSLLGIALNEKVLNRDVKLYVAFFSNGVIIADPVLEWSGRGDVMYVTEQSADDGSVSSISFTAESRYAAMLRPKSRRHNNEDQQIDHPGDRFYEFQAALVDRELVWPAASFFKK